MPLYVVLALLGVFLRVVQFPLEFVHTFQCDAIIPIYIGQLSKCGLKSTCLHREILFVCIGYTFLERTLSHGSHLLDMLFKLVIIVNEYHGHGFFHTPIELEASVGRELIHPQTSSRE